MNHIVRTAALVVAMTGCSLDLFHDDDPPDHNDPGGSDELAVLELVNGKNTVIVRKSQMGSFEVSKMLYRLLSIKLVRLVLGSHDCNG